MIPPSGKRRADNGPAVAVSISDRLPKGFEDGLIDETRARRLQIEVRRVTAGPFAGIEGYLPTAVIVFLAAGYFNGFLQKMGEDHYETLKDLSRRLLSRVAGLDLRSATKSGEAAAALSPTFSIVVETSVGARIKLVLRTGLMKEEGERATDAFLDLLRQLQSNEHLRQAWLARHRQHYGTILVTYETASDSIEAVERGP